MYRFVQRNTINGPQLYVRQFTFDTKRNALIYAAVVGSQNIIKEFVVALNNSEKGAWTFESLDENNTWRERVYRVNSQYYSSGYTYKAFYHKLGTSGFYEALIISREFLEVLQNTQKGIYNKNTNTKSAYDICIMVRASDAFKTKEEFDNFTNQSYAERIQTICSNSYMLEQFFQNIKLQSPVPVIREWMPTIMASTASTPPIQVEEGSRYTQAVLSRYYDCDFSEALIAVVASFYESALKSCISESIRSNRISFGTKIKNGTVMNRRNLSQYLESFGDILVQRAHERFHPLYIPGVSEPNENAKLFFTNSRYFGNLNFFDAQKDIISSIALSLNRNKKTIVVGECGSGKTSIALGSIYTHAKKKNPVSLVMAPGHLVEKWQTEIKRLYPCARTQIIDSFEDILKWEEKIKNKKLDAPLFLIVGKDACKLDYEEHPILKWSNRHGGFIHPLEEHNSNTYGKEEESRINQRIENNSAKDALYDGQLLTPNAITFFLKKNNRNMYIVEEKTTLKHENNGKRNYSKFLMPVGKFSERDKKSPLWTIANPSDINNEWVKIPKNGWVNTEAAKVFIAQCDNKIKRVPLTKDELNAYAIAKTALENSAENTHGIRRYNLSRYIREHIKFDYFIADEVHLYSSKDTAQGRAFTNFLKASKYTIALTGTLLNGYAQNIFSMLFKMYPRIFIKNGFDYDSNADFAKQYGVVETIEEYSESYYHGNSPIKTTQKYKPGVSPMLFSKFLLDKAVFITLSDITSDLPNYEEIPVGVHMDSKTKIGYNAFAQMVREAIQEHPDTRDKFIFKAVQRLSQYPDQPYNQIPIFNNDTGEQILCPPNIQRSTAQAFYSAKDMETLRLVQKHKEKGEKVLIYIHWVDALDCSSRLLKLLRDNGIKAEHLSASVSARNREQWIRKKTEEGIDVLICNPSLVETGLDLLDFTTIIFYQTGYNLFTMRQASRRSLRLNQSNDVTVYFLYFKDTIQENILSLMANKLQAAMAIEGKFSEEGLNAMSENDALLTQIANNLTHNIDVKLSEGAFDFHTIKAQTSGNRFKFKAETLMRNWYVPMKNKPKKGKEVISIPEQLKLVV